jgi:hypothetical protein
MHIIQSTTSYELVEYIYCMHSRKAKYVYRWPE